MMTMNNVIQSALDSLGYSSNNGNTQLTDRVRKRCRTLFEGEYVEILRLVNKPLKPLPDWNKDLGLTPLEAQALIMGVATVIAHSESDDFNYNFFASRYESSKRGLNKLDEVEDVIPVPAD